MDPSQAGTTARTVGPRITEPHTSAEPGEAIFPASMPRLVLARARELTHGANLRYRSLDMNPISEWRKRAALFPEPQPLAVAIEHVPDLSTPEPYKALLVHNDHMTAMMERFHGSPVDVRVLARRIDGTAYSRKIILVRQDTGAVVQFALAQFDLNAVSEGVRRRSWASRFLSAVCS